MTTKSRRTGKLGNLYSRRQALLLGNGLNLTVGGASWGRLLKNLVRASGLEGQVKVRPRKPYPLTFEEILFADGKPHFYERLKFMRQQIAQEINRYQPGELHRLATDSGVKAILTTNHDYAIERTRVPAFSGPKHPTSPREYRYSLHRRSSVSGLTVWHINGEASNGYRGKGLTQYPEESILIGHEHYADYLSKLHSTLKPPLSGQGLAKVLAEHQTLWARLFFSHDLHIIGLSLDFTEIHLWWLLNFRARLKRSGTSIANKLIFYRGSFERGDQDKLALLKALDVQVKMITVRQTKPTVAYPELYKSALAMVARG